MGLPLPKQSTKPKSCIYDSDFGLVCGAGSGTIGSLLPNSFFISAFPFVGSTGAVCPVMGELIESVLVVGGTDGIAGVDFNSLSMVVFSSGSRH